MRIVRESPRAADGSIKVTFVLDSGFQVEGVYISNGETYGLCLSVQAGCGMGCLFCATAMQASRHNLTGREICEQASLMVARLGRKELLTFITLAGMGEPLANYDNVMEGLERLRARWGSIVLSLSTVGLTHRLSRMDREGRDFRVYLSLHGARDETRVRLMPIARRYPIGPLLSAASAYAEGRPFGAMQVSYLLLKGVNDTDEEFADLANLMEGRGIPIQILLWNRVRGLQFRRARLEDALRLESFLRARGLFVYTMPSKGRGVGAACGQLVSRPRRALGMHAVRR